MNNQPRNKSESVGENARIYQRGGTWHMNLQHNGRQIRRSLKTTNKKQARARAIEYEQKLSISALPQRLKSNHFTIKEITVLLIENCKLEARRPKTLQKYSQVLTRFVEYADQNDLCKLGDFDLSHLDKYRKGRQDEGAQPKTIYTEIGIIRRLISFAKSRQIVTENPLAGLKIKKPRGNLQPCWSSAEIDRILQNASPLHRPVFVILAKTGLRIGELKWLTWQDIDWESRMIHIRPKDNWTTKSGNMRSIPLREDVQRVLEGLPRDYRWVVTAGPSRKYPRGGHQISERRLLESLKRTLNKVSLKGHLHTFRHSFISQAIVAGTPSAIVRQWVGHVDEDTLRLYTHIASQDSRQAMERFENFERESESAGDRDSC